MKHFLTLLFSLFLLLHINAQTWQSVGNGTNNSSHGLLTWNGKLIDLGSFNNPCNRVAAWNGTTWECLGGGVGLVARAGTVWNGNLVVVGDFWNVFQPCTNCNGVAMWNGTQWTNIGAGFNNDVLCITVWDGDLVVAGDFTQSNGVPCNRIAKWNGTAWEQIGPNNAFNNDIRAMVEFENELWVGGDFMNVAGCSSCDGLVKWSGTGWVGGDSGVDVQGGVDTTVRVLYVNPYDGKMYMGGHFTELNLDGVINTNCKGIAVYDGSDWAPLGTGMNDYVRAIHEYNGNIIAGGYFTNAGGVSANRIAKWNPVSQTWSAMGLGFNGVGIDEYVKSATVWNGTFFAGGAYSVAEGNSMNHIAKWFEAPVALPEATINAEQTALCTGGCFSFTDESTYGPTSWQWSFPGGSITSSTMQDPPPICYSTGGTYTVTLQACNSVGCNTTTQTINVISSPTVAVNNPTICSGSSAVITANPSVSGGTFLWSPGGQTTSSITVSPTSNTTYSVTYTTPGCGSTNATSTVTVSSSAPTVSVNNPTICAGTNTVITASPSTSGGTYSWYPGGETTQTITVNPTSTETYTVSYTLGGCSSSPTISTVTVNPSPTITVDNQTICSGSSANLTATPSTAGGTYLWSPGGQTTQSISINPTSTTSYSVVYTNAGCPSPSIAGSVTVNQVPILSVNNPTICSGSSAILTATPSITGGNYLWSPGGESTASITVNPSTTSPYSVSYTVNGCASAPTISNVTVVPNPSISVNNETICSGATATLIANPSASGGTYSWLPGGETTQSITVNPGSSATYTVSYSVPGCATATSTGDVTVNQTPSLSVNDLSECSGEMATLTAIPSQMGGTYQWSPGNETTQSIQVNPTSTSTYSVIYTLNGCQSLTEDATLTIIQGPSTVVSVSQNVLTSLQAGATYQWIDCTNGNTPVFGQTAQSFTATTNAEYALEITLNGCTEISDCYLINTNALGENHLSTELIVSPNPTFDNVLIAASNELIGSFVILTDGNGRIVKRIEISSQQTTMELTDVESGIYYIRVENSSNALFKLIKL